MAALVHDPPEIEHCALVALSRSVTALEERQLIGHREPAAPVPRRPIRIHTPSPQTATT